MVSSLGPTGLTIDTLTQLVAALTEQMQAIYGADINVASNSPDGQLINIFMQNVEDLLELVQSVYNSFGYMTAYGTQLDQRLALLGIERKQGTNTTTPVLVTVNQALTLYGLDQTDQPVYTLVDQTGNLWALAETYVFGSAGSAFMTFQSVTIGAIGVSANVITQQSTTVLGVTSVNNPVTSITTTATTAMGFATITAIPTTAGMYVGMTIAGDGIPVSSTVLSVDSATQVTISANATADASGVTIVVATPEVVNGIPEENDTQFKVRAAQSFALASTGPADAVEAALDNVADVTDAFVVENDTGSSDGDGVPAHSIWCIVAGGTDAEIGQAIYSKKAPGCGMKGSQSYVVTRPNGTTFTSKWDTALSQPLYIKFGIIWRGGVALDDDSIIAALAVALSYKLNQPASVGDVVTAMNVIAPTAIVDLTGSQGMSTDGITYAAIVSPDSPQYAFSVSAANIVIS